MAKQWVVNYITNLDGDNVNEFNCEARRLEDLPALARKNEIRNLKAKATLPKKKIQTVKVQIVSAYRRDIWLLNPFAENMLLIDLAVKAIRTINKERMVLLSVAQQLKKTEL